MSFTTSLTSYTLTVGSYTSGTIDLPYGALDFTPSATDSYKSTSGDVFKVFINGVRIYRQNDSVYANGNGFLEVTDNANGNTLNNVTDSGSTNWGRTNNLVWVINTTANKIVLNPAEIANTSLYGSSGLNITVSNGDIIELRRAVQDLKTPAVDFSNASILTEQDLDNSAKNVFHVAQQAVTGVDSALLYNTGTASYQSYVPGSSTNAKISNLADGSATNDAVNKGQLTVHDTTITGYRDTTLAYREDTEDYKLESQDWAQRTGSQVRVYTDNNRTGSDLGYSAKEWALGTTVADGSAKDWATQDTSAISGGLFSAKEYASGSSATGGTSKEWAQKSDGAVDTEFSAKAYASVTGSNAPTDGSAKEWATTTGGVVASSEYSAKEYAQGATATGGTSKEWAQKNDGAVDTEFSAKAYASVTGTHAPTDGSAKEWATTTGGAVASSEHSAKSYANETGSNAPPAGSAKEWATVTGAVIADSEYSSKEYATGTTVASGSSKEWATTTGSAVASSEYSAKEYAQGTTATGGTAKEWAQDTSGAVDTTFSAKEYAQGSQSGTGGSAKNWATQFNADVTGASTGDMSAKEWAVGVLGRGVANEGSSKDWATYTAGTVDNSEYSSKKYAQDASESALAAKNSAAAVSNVYENFADTYLGSMADGATASSGSANGTWAKNSSSITLASTSGTIEVGQEVTGTGIPADANVLSIDGSTIVISENMAASGSGVSLTFTGHGVYGAFNVSKDGPGTDNDGDALATGMLYFNTSDNEMRIYDGGNWIAASAAGSASFIEYRYVATNGQTTFSGNDANGNSLSYVVNNAHVFLNGVRLDPTDMTATNGTSIVLGSGASANDELIVIAWKSFTTADMVPASTGGTFQGNVISTGTIQGNVTVASGKTLDVSAGTLTTSTAQKQAIVQAGPGSGTIDVSSGTLTTSTAQKQAIVDGSSIEGTAIKSTGESGGAKFLREDGDGTCSFQAVTGIPSGMIAPFGMASAPTGWLICNGATVSRSTYSALFAIIGTTWGSGDGSSTFHLPDLRGAVLRGTGTAGVSSDYAGPNVGAYQDDQNAEHNHSASSSSSGSTNSTGSHQHNAAGNTPFAGSHSANLGAFNGYISSSHQKVASAGSHSHSLSVSTSTSIGNSGSTEARMYNRGVQYCIKF